MSRPSLEGVDSSEETDMQAAAIFVSIFAGIFVAIFLTCSPLWREAEDRARARRIADARMNARLLRLNL
jgi:hypothetical protein